MTGESPRSRGQEARSRGQEPPARPPRPLLPAAVLAGMTVLQLAWLAAIFVTGATRSTDRVLAAAVISVVAALVALACPARLVDRLNRAGSWIAARDARTAAAIALAVLSVGAAFLFQRNHTLGDERELLSVVRSIADEGLGPFFERYASYPWLGDRHPPLVPVYFGLAARLVGTGIEPLRAFALPAAVGVALLTWQLGRRVYGRDRAALGALALVAMPYFFRLGTLVMLDMLFVLWTTLAFVLLVDLERRPTVARGLAIGLAAGLALLTKYHVVVVAPAMLVWVVVRRPGRQVVAPLAVASAAALAVAGTWVAAAFALGVVGEQTHRIGAHLAAGAGSTFGTRFLLETVASRLPSAIGPAVIPIVAAGLWAAWRRRDRADLALLAAVAAAWLPLFLTLPDPRYFMPTFPLLALAAGAWLAGLAPRLRARAVMLLVGHSAAALYLFWNWQRSVKLFLS